MEEGMKKGKRRGKKGINRGEEDGTTKLDLLSRSIPSTNPFGRSFGVDPAIILLLFHSLHLGYSLEHSIEDAFLE